MRSFFYSLVLSLAVLSLATPAHAVPPLPKPKLIAVYFWASWCTNCKVLSPALEQARADGALDAKDVLFVKLDLSDSATIHQSVMLATALGIDKFVQAQGSATGYVAVLSADKKRELKRFDRESKAADIGAEVTRLLAAAH